LLFAAGIDVGLREVIPFPVKEAYNHDHQ